MKCVLYLDDPKSEFAECDPNDCDRLGCKLNSNYDKREEIKDMDFAKPGRYSMSSIILILLVSLLLLLPIPPMILNSGFTLLNIIVSIFLSFCLFIFYYRIVYKTSKYWNDNYNQIQNEIEKRLMREE